MSTKKLVLDLIAFVLAIGFLMFFIPWSLNARDTFTNLLGTGTIIAVAIGVVAVVHNKLTKSFKE